MRYVVRVRVNGGDENPRRALWQWFRWARYVFKGWDLI